MNEIALFLMLFDSVGHKGKFGHEFLEFELQPDGKLRYANHSNYKQDSMIRKEMYVGKLVQEEIRRIVLESEVMREDDRLWPAPDRNGRQELEIIWGGEHICFSV